MISAVALLAISNSSLAAQGQAGPPQVNPQMTYYTVASHGTATPPVGFASGSFGRISVAQVAGDYLVAFRALKFDPGSSMAIWVGSGTGVIGNPIVSFGHEGQTLNVTPCTNIGTLDAGIPPHINSSGLVTFFATMASINCGPLQTILGKTLQTSHAILAQQGMIPAGGTIAISNIHNDYGLASNGKVAFRGSVGPANQTTGIWEANGATVRDIAKTGDSAVGSVGATFNAF